MVGHHWPLDTPLKGACFIHLFTVVSTWEWASLEQVTEVLYFQLHILFFLNRFLLRQVLE